MPDPVPHPDLPAISQRWMKLLMWYAPRYVDRHFSAVKVMGEVPDVADARPLLIYLNHPSWWDPMAALVLTAKYFRGRPGYGPIDAAGLQRYRFMEKLGFFGIKMDSRAGAARFLRVGRTVLTTPGQTLWVTAEGHFTDPRKRPVVLRPGIAHLARKLPAAGGKLPGWAGAGAGAVPLAIEYGYGQEKLPEMRLAFGAEIPLGDASRSVEYWNALLEARLTETMDRLAAASMAADDAAFATIGRGRRGVGGVYDGWRWTRARLKGQRFDPGHAHEAGERPA